MLLCAERERAHSQASQRGLTRLRMSALLPEPVGRGSLDRGQASRINGSGMIAEGTKGRGRLEPEPSCDSPRQRLPPSHVGYTEESVTLEVRTKQQTLNCRGTIQHLQGWRIKPAWVNEGRCLTKSLWESYHVSLCNCSQRLCNRFFFKWTCSQMHNQVLSKAQNSLWLHLLLCIINKCPPTWVHKDTRIPSKEVHNMIAARLCCSHSSPETLQNLPTS